MKVNNTVIKNIIDDIKTSFIEFLKCPDPDNTNSFVWYMIITLIVSVGITLCEAFYMWPLQFAETHNQLYFHEGANSVLLWLLTISIVSIFCITGWLIIGFIYWLFSAYKEHYYDKYGRPSDKLRNHDII